MILLRIRKVRCSFFRPSAATSTSGSAWQIFARRPLRRATSGDRFPTAIHTAAFRLFIGTLPQAVVRSFHEPRDDTHKDRRKEQDPAWATSATCSQFILQQRKTIVERGASWR